MSLPIDTAEEKKMVEFLNAKGITTLEQLKAIFKRCEDETVEEEVVFVKQVAGPSISQEKINQIIQASTRNKEKILDVLSKTANTAENSKPQPEPPNQNKVVRQSNANAELGHCVVNAVNAVNIASLLEKEKNATSLPLRAPGFSFARPMAPVGFDPAGPLRSAGPQRYRHKNSHLSSPRPTKQTRTNIKLQQQERIRQTAKQNELQMGVNNEYSEFNQYPQCIRPPLNQSSQNQCEQYNENNHLNHHYNHNPTHLPIHNANALNHHTFQGARQNIATVYNSAPGFNNANAFSSSTSFNNGTGFNNTTNYNNATDYNNGFNSAKSFKTTNNFDNSIGHAIQVTQPMLSTPIYNGPAQQTWPRATSLHTGQSYNNNFRRIELATQTQAQQPCAQYVMGNRPVFDPN